ncbi:MAG: KH domain-containing protein [Bacilli bacterium]|nr:KH domain-containing protein [Bacilli bacterium]
MDLVELTKEIIVSLSTDKDSVSVKEFESDEENTILIQVMVSEEDYGRIIGKAGKNINAVRTLVQASSYLKDNKRVKINVDKF